MSRSGQTILTEDDRAMLADEAAAHERAARPRHLVLLAALLLACALAGLSVSWKRFSNASEKARNEERTAAETALLTKRLKDLTAAIEAAGPRMGEQPTQMLSMISDAASASGLTNPLPLPAKRTERGRGGAQQALLTYDVKDQSLPAILGWIDQATKSVSGLEVQKLLVKPEPQQWSVSVTLARWERTENP